MIQVILIMDAIVNFQSPSKKNEKRERERERRDSIGPDFWATIHGSK
jgi:hypothetical protein